jgi:hypothetical protein
MTILNTANQHQGTWPRVNRKNQNEKSVIDCIMMTASINEKIMESAIDEEGLYLIKGKHATYHNVISIDVEMRVYWQAMENSKQEQFKTS